MRERRKGLGNHTINHIVAQTGLGLDQTKTIVLELLDMGYSKGDIYRLLMDGDGAPSTHLSGEKEGMRLAPGRNAARKRSIRRTHIKHI